jgi:hypothetical protein
MMMMMAYHHADLNTSRDGDKDQDARITGRTFPDNRRRCTAGLPQE